MSSHPSNDRSAAHPAVGKDQAALLLQVTGLQKNYNAPVLVDFAFDLRPGEVHALVGSNGAGKSTFARILSGLVKPDGGHMWLKGQPYAPPDKLSAEQAGIVMVMQELNLIGTLSVAENIFLDRLPASRGFVRFGELSRCATNALAKVGLNDLDPMTPAGTLGVGHQQLVEIAGALARHCRVLILDEPTAALTHPEIEQLFKNIRQLQASGVGIIYVSHRMDEIKRIANRITVLRDGRSIATYDADKVETSALIRDMAGHDLPARSAGTRPVIGETVLEVQHLCAGERVMDVSFSARAGEIVGIAGLIGSGRTETLRAIFGADSRSKGEIFVRGRCVKNRSPQESVRNGIAMIPEDRKHDGLLLTQSICVNTTLVILRRCANAFGWLNRTAETSVTEELRDRLNVRCASIEQPAAELSGGNQQKVVIARWLARDCDVLLFDEPTRGVDAAAKDAIHALLRELARQGKTIVVVSSELTELTLVSDRILVMSAGRIAAEFTPENWSQEKITAAAFSGYGSRLAIAH